MTLPSGATAEVDGPERADSSKARGNLGSLVALLAFVSLLLAPLGSLSPEAHRLAAIMAAV
ncbi:MAG TPA: hypothetical protein VFH13_04865, partial [Gemmatimonadaceae bacterium]|nr:hypothetical protein [Gemmatimonadaceae bacterium]